jgi:hypothetical protein
VKHRGRESLRERIDPNRSIMFRRAVEVLRQNKAWKMKAFEHSPN